MAKDQWNVLINLLKISKNIMLETAHPLAYSHKMNINDQIFEEKVILN